ncbi:hypothetical protein RND71_022638 [Anisodus tanguticus]|uniref:Plastocyanin-like domain-containing protein n=1 Tax=Anisodus tanguticus TaxID=243964 RepID=A0AAE1RSF8_9SOLA|nr:hypothetical protein RND71_022638 [Anisodus tanguticus]
MIVKDSHPTALRQFQRGKSEYRLRHEKHGTCSYPVVHDEYEYFLTTLNVYFKYNVTGILKNGQFPGSTIECVINDNLIINIFNSLDEPFLISCKRLKDLQRCIVLPIDSFSSELCRHRAILFKMAAVETAYDEFPNIFDTGGAKGLPGDSVEKIPKIVITNANYVDEESPVQPAYRTFNWERQLDVHHNVITCLIFLVLIHSY